MIEFNSSTNMIFVILGGDYYKENNSIDFYFSIDFILNAYLLFCRKNKGNLHDNYNEILCTRGRQGQGRCYSFGAARDMPRPF